MTLITLLGQTSSGKSQMAVELAKFLDDSWIVNCDSRQIYKDLNIGTGKVEGKWEGGIFYYQDIPHFLIDYVSPIKNDYTLVNYIQDFTDLFKTGSPKFVILTGGTGLYAKAIVEKFDLGIIKPEFESSFRDLKQFLNSQSLDELQKTYLSNFETYVSASQISTLNHSDFCNSRRLVGRILKMEADNKNWTDKLEYPGFDKTFEFAIDSDQDELKSKIETRLSDRINQGLQNEVKKLQYLGKERLLNLGLEYRLTQLFIEGEIEQKQWKERLLIENRQYAKRQLTWLKKQPNLTWIKSIKEIENNF